MRILYLLDMLPNNGGAPISTVLIANWMASSNEVYIGMPSGGFDVSCLDKRIKVCQYNKATHFSPSIFTKPFAFFAFAGELSGLVNSIRPSIVHIETPISGWAIGFSLMKRKIKSDAVFIYHDRACVAQSSFPVRFITNFLIKRRIHNIVVLTDRGIDFWQRKNRNRVFVIPNCPGGIFESLNISRLIDREVLQVTFIGRFTKEKNWPKAIKIIKKFHDVKYNVVVSFPKEKESKVQRYFSKCLCKKASIDFFYNAPQELISKLLYQTDILVMTSKKESFGRTAVEAMSRKCVVLGTDVGGIPFVIEKKDNISNSYQRIIERIAFYNFNRKELKTDKEYFFSRYKKFFSLDSYIENHVKLYSEVLK